MLVCALLASGYLTFIAPECTIPMCVACSPARNKGSSKETRVGWTAIASCCSEPLSRSRVIGTCKPSELKHSGIQPSFLRPVLRTQQFRPPAHEQLSFFAMQVQRQESTSERLNASLGMHSNVAGLEPIVPKVECFCNVHLYRHNHSMRPTSMTGIWAAAASSGWDHEAREEYDWIVHEHSIDCDICCLHFGQ